MLGLLWTLPQHAGRLMDNEARATSIYLRLHCEQAQTALERDAAVRQLKPLDISAGSEGTGPFNVAPFSNEPAPY